MMNFLTANSLFNGINSIDEESCSHSMEHNFFRDYSIKLSHSLTSFDWSKVFKLAKMIEKAWKEGSQVFLCGNGGSAGNASHIANDLVYAISEGKKPGIKANALTTNSSVITCLANDLGYKHIFSKQLEVAANKGDILIALSGSGNSPNIIQALRQAKRIKMRSVAILGFSGGACKNLSDLPIHFNIDDMQMAEDIQLIIAHMVMQWLRERVKLAN